MNFITYFITFIISLMFTNAKICGGSVKTMEIFSKKNKWGSKANEGQFPWTVSIRKLIHLPPQIEADFKHKWNLTGTIQSNTWAFDNRGFNQEILLEYWLNMDSIGTMMLSPQLYKGRALSDHLCSGALIGDKWVLTSGDCIELNTENSLKVSTAWKSNKDQDYLMDILEIYIRCSHKSAELEEEKNCKFQEISNRKGGFALLRINPTFNLNENVYPICYDEIPYCDNNIHGSMIAVGWGGIEVPVIDNYPFDQNVLRYGYLKTAVGMKELYCEAIINGTEQLRDQHIHERFLNEKEIYTPLLHDYNGTQYFSGVPEYGNEICKVMNHGSPVFAYLSRNKHFELIGITTDIQYSYFEKCTSEKSQAYVSIISPEYKKWIKHKMNASESCGKRPLFGKPGTERKSDRYIYKGWIPKEGQFPWAVSLLEYSDDDKKYHLFCSGSIVSMNYVLTAGHCITLKSRHITFKLIPIYIYAGSVDSENPKSKHHIEAIYRLQDYCVDSKVPYENRPKRCMHKYKIFDELDAGDIVLLKAYPEFIFDDTTQPICLDIFGVNIVNWMDELYMAGFGGTRFVEFPVDYKEERILHVDGKLRYDKVIVNVLLHEEYIASNNFSSHHDFAGACQGDSGSGLAKYREETDQWVIVGVMSASTDGLSGTCWRSYQAFFARVSYFREFFEGIIEFLPKYDISWSDL